MKRFPAAALALATAGAFATPSVPGGRFIDPGCDSVNLSVAPVCTVGSSTGCNIEWSTADSSFGFDLLQISIREQGDGYNPFTPVTLDAVRPGDSTTPGYFAFTPGAGSGPGGSFTPSFTAISWSNAIAFDNAEYLVGGGCGSGCVPTDTASFPITIDRIRGDRLVVRMTYVCNATTHAQEFVIQVLPAERHTPKRHTPKAACAGCEVAPLPPRKGPPTTPSDPIGAPGPGDPANAPHR